MKNKQFSLIHRIAILFFLSVIALSSCNDAPNEEFKPGYTTINGTIQGLQNQYILIKNELPEFIEPDTIQLDENGSFMYTIKIDKPAYYGVLIGRDLIQLYLRPNDTLNIKAPLEQLLDKLQFSGKSAIYNNYLLKSYKHEQRIQSSIYKFFNAPENLVVSRLDSLREMDYKKIESFSSNFLNLDAYFVKIEKARALYSWALNRTIYPKYFDYVFGKNGATLSQNYSTYLSELDLNDSSLLVIPQFRRFLNNYFVDKLTELEKESSNEEMANLSSRILKVQDYFVSTKIRDFMCFELVKNQIKYFGNRDADTILNSFGSICKNKKYIQFIENKFGEWNHLNRGKIAEDFTFINQRGDSISLSNFKGKYVLIDVWATWCRPCLDQIPQLEDLVKKFSGRNIVFLSISVDQDKQVWNKMVQEKKLKGYQLYAGRSDVLKDFYKVSGIPRFILIGKNGEIVESNCVSPNENLDKYISKLEGL